MNMNFEDFPSLRRSRKAQTEGEKLESGVPGLAELTLEGLNLKAELLTQYNRTRQMLHEASYDSTIPLNQKAQVINAATSILGQLTKSEAELHSVEEVKKIEAVLIDTLKLFPELQEGFLLRYKEMSEAYDVR